MTGVPAYRNPASPADKRVKDLLARMTLEEKAAQMLCQWRNKANTLVDPNGNFDLEKAEASFKKGQGLGQVGRPADAGCGKDARAEASLANAIQRFFLEHSRLGIPVVFHEECLHGHMAPGGTTFSQPIGLAATFNPELIEALFAMAGAEARLRGVHQALAPVVEVARDPRWGGVEGTFGEDPYLVSRLGIAAVRGLQGDASFRDKRHVIATLKRLVGSGQPESGMNCAPANVPMRALRDTFLYPFKEAIQKAGAISVMPSSNEVDGVPSHGSKWLLRAVLRKEWGFKGYVVSDFHALEELCCRTETHGHSVAKDKKESCKLAVEAGVNIELPEPDCYLHLVDLVKKGELKESQLDELLAPMLYWKFRLGLFEDPYVDPDDAEKFVGCGDNRKLALKAAHETITLLKNENNLLPLNANAIRSIAVIGPNAHRTLLGGYSGVPKYNSTVLDGILAKVGSRVKVLYSEGCKITVGGSWQQDEVTPSDVEEDRRQIKEAIRVARQTDVIVLAIGGNEQTSREAWTRNHMGDRASLDLIGRQEELVKAMVATGKPVVVILFHGRPNSIACVAQNVQAILECWYLGQESGYAIADVLFGDVNPSGKLPITIPRSAGHLPAFYAHKPSARSGYLFDEAEPLYEFGYGLSYTTFSVANVRLSKKRVGVAGSTSVLAEVTNRGGRAGAEVVQMYVRDVVSSVTRPVKELKGFQKVFLKPGETKTVEIPITPESLAFYDINMKYTVEPGEFKIMVGNSSRDADLQSVTLMVR